MNIFSNKTFLVLSFFLSYGCNSDQPRKISVETAEESNKAIQKNDLSGVTEAKHKVASDFMIEAASGSLMEITLGKLAQIQSQNDEVKIFGKQMETDHGKANEQLELLATAKNIVIPAAPTQDHQKHINQLAELKGADFDRKYLDMMITDHQNDIKLFQNAANNNDMDAEVKAFAQKTLPILRQHLQMAQQTQRLVK